MRRLTYRLYGANGTPPDDTEGERPFFGQQSYDEDAARAHYTKGRGSGAGGQSEFRGPGQTTVPEQYRMNGMSRTQ